MTLITKILGVLCIVGFLGSFIGAILVLNKNMEIQRLENDIGMLETSNGVLTHNIETVKSICTAERDGVKHQQEEIDILRKRETENLSKIENILTNQEKTNDPQNKATADTLLPDNLVRLLDDVCTDVRGQTCPNP